MINENRTIKESQSKELSEIKERHAIEIQKREEELMETKVSSQDTMQQYEDRQAELGMKIKTLGLTIQDFQEEKDLYKEERAHMLQDFDEDMRRISFENESMKKEITFLRNKLDTVVKEKKEMEQFTSDREKELTEDLKALEKKMLAMRGRSLGQNEKTSELSKKCRKYNKLIHKLRDKLALIQADSDRVKMEKEAMVGYISPESHSNVRKQLMDLQQKQKEFANVFSHMGECEKINNEKQEKIALINKVAATLIERKIESKEFLEEIESEKYSISFEINEQISKAEDSDTKENNIKNI
jgi:chromosome segregation ATPase